VEVWRAWVENDVFEDDTDGMAVFNCGGERITLRIWKFGEGVFE
jgi:hypothetical protein